MAGENWYGGWIGRLSALRFDERRTAKLTQAIEYRAKRLADE
ncbi:MAG: hypothetical protein ACI9OJ_005598 [Myxococcota bacterium]